MTTKNSKKDARYLASQLLERIPGVEVKVTAPSGRGTVWWVDVSSKGHNVVIEWSLNDGFGVSSTDGNEFNTAASHVFPDADDVLSFILDVFKAGKKIPLRREMHLQHLREHRAISQEALSDLMQISQASISKTERREDMLLSTLRAFVEALGAELLLVAKFPSESIEINLQSSDRRKRAS